MNSFMRYMANNHLNESIEIRTEVDRRNLNVCRFTVDRTLYVGTKTITRTSDVERIPLAQRLLQVPGVDSLQLIGHLLVVTKAEDRPWEDICREVEAILTAYLISGMALTEDQVQERMMLIGKSISEKIQYLLDQQINPGVAAHAGFVELVDVKDDTVYVRLSGGCQGCGAADFTLKHGIETIVRERVPEIHRIVDVTDHAAGTEPYYQRPGRN